MGELEPDRPAIRERPSSFYDCSFGSLFLERHEADRPPRLVRRLHQGVYGTEDFFKPGVGLEIEGKQSALEIAQPCAELPLRGERVAHAYEGPHHMRNTNHQAAVPLLPISAGQLRRRRSRLSARLW
jgi:hypothetical protein